MNLIALSAWDLILAAGLVVLLAALSWRLCLGVGRRVLVAALRGTVQLMLVGLVLKQLFAQANPDTDRTHRPGHVVGGGLGSAKSTETPLHRTLGLWYRHPLPVSVVLQRHFAGAAGDYQVEPLVSAAIPDPLLGMLLGNTMSGWPSPWTN